MTHHTTHTHASERGFTLVELAIVMIIIGLLIGGILKGQELIGNARLSSTVAQIKAVESGVSTFRDRFAAYPGDISSPDTRIPNCATTTLCGATVAVADGTQGNGIIENTGKVSNPGIAGGSGTETGKAFVQLGAAGMIGGVQSNAGSSATLAGGITNPETPLGGSWVIGSSAGSATGMVVPAGLPAGVYIASTPLPSAAIPTGDAQMMTPVQAANIDRKVDDGQPGTGIVRAIGNGTPAATTCTGTTGAYNESLTGTLCGVYAKVQ